MTTLFATTYFPQVATKLFWIKANRVLAWSLIVSPVLQLAIGMRFETGLLIDVAILAAHGVLSVALFGKPETRERTWNFFTHAMGFKSVSMSERNRFLLSGYRIALAVAALALIPLSGGYVAFAVCMVCLYPLLRLPISIAQHIFLSVGAAMRRWRKRDNAEMAATAILFLYFFISLLNLVRGSHG